MAWKKFHLRMTGYSMFENKLNYYLSRVNDALSKYKIEYECPNDILFKSVNYSLFASGKRLRPIIMVAACEMAGGDANEVLPFAAALEMIHTSSLIHDDLPAMDNDDLRRGNPTNHKVFGEATAILAGDSLLVRPFEIMAQNATSQRHIEAIEIIAHAAGFEGMMGGQQIDLDSEGKQIDKETIITLNTLKTGALFIAAVETGVVIAGASMSERKSAIDYGKNLGLAFQLVDDLLDNDENANTGKTKGSDIKLGKSTYLSIYGEEKCHNLINKCTQDAAKNLSVFGEKSEFLVQLVKNLQNRIK